MDQHQRQRIALFRFGVIAELVDCPLGAGERQARVRGIAEKDWQVPFSGRQRVSRSTVLAWLARYEASGRRIESLMPRERRDRGSSKSISAEDEQALVVLRRELPAVNLPVLLREARTRRVLSEQFRASPQSVYRMLKRHGLQRERAAPQDRRRFEAELPNDQWQADCLHGPRVLVADKRRKTYLFACIDDHSRLITHAEFYLNESLDSFCDCLLTALARRGLPRTLYVDNGPAFRSHQLRYGCASLGIAVLHSRPYQPEGRGKIERFFRTLRQQVLALVADEVNLAELNLVLESWLERDYHRRRHSSTGQPPLQRYLDHVAALRSAPKEVRDHFRIAVRRRVDKDRTVSLHGKLFEAPTGLIGQTVTLLYHRADPQRIEVICDERSWGFLVPLDLTVDSRVRRATGHDTELLSDPVVDPASYRGGELFDRPPRS